MADGRWQDEDRRTEKKFVVRGGWFVDGSWLKVLSS